MGAGAVVVPLGFVIATDLAPPKNRGVATVLINVASQLGSFFASAISIYFGTGKPFDTRSFPNGSEEYNKRSTASYNAAMYCSLGTFLASVVICLLIMKESHPRINAMRKLKSMGISATKSEETKNEPILRVLVQMCRNRDILLLFFAYWINMIGSTNTRTGATVLISKVYGFTDSNYAKAYSETT